MATIGKDLTHAKHILENDGVIGLPTETVYGLAGNALKEPSITKIYQIKNRPSFDPLIAHVDSIEKVKGIVKYIPEELEPLINTLWPGPLTLLLPKKENVPYMLTSGLDRVAVRIPNHPLALALLKSLDFPLAAPSANPFGYISPTTPQHVDHQLGTKVEYILDGGACQVGVESTIIGYENGRLYIHRLGGLSVEDIENLVGPVTIDINQSSNPKAPGMLKSHYAPTKKLLLGVIDNFKNESQNQRIGTITFSREIDWLPKANQIILSKTGDINEAAANLFKSMRQMDSMNVDIILTELLPEIGLGRAINDRLKRAAVQ